MRNLTLVALGVLLSVNAFAQTIVDEFDGGFDPNLPWSWLVVIPDNDPNTCDLVNTENTDYYAFRDGELVLTMHPWNSVYAQWNYAVNFPNLPVASMNAGWAIETEVTLDLNGNTPGVYTQAGIILMQDMDNYYSVQLVIDPNASPISYWLSTAHEVNRSYQYGGASAGFWGAGAPSFHPQDAHRRCGTRRERQPAHPRAGAAARLERLCGCLAVAVPHASIDRASGRRERRARRLFPCRGL
jgi:hypothetical protein